MKKRTKPVKAYDNHGFLHSHSGRIVRVLSEFIEPQHRFEQYHINNTIVFFGSARSMPVKAYRKKRPAPGQVREKGLYLNRAYESCVELARRITDWSNRIKAPKKRFHICSGGGPGMMEAANKGAKRAGGKSIGLNISLPFEQMPNPHISPELNFEFHYFFIRKFWFLYYAKALIAFPGGFGTLDEALELLTLLQTRKLEKKVPVVFFGKQFWSEVLNIRALVAYGVISKKDLRLFRIIDTVDEAFDYVTGTLRKMYL
jgi:uncharacterized protein (TIGR00730 family)